MTAETRPKTEGQQSGRVRLHAPIGTSMMILGASRRSLPRQSPALAEHSSRRDGGNGRASSGIGARSVSHEGRSGALFFPGARFRPKTVNNGSQLLTRAPAMNDDPIIGSCIIIGRKPATEARVFREFVRLAPFRVQTPRKDSDGVGAWPAETTLPAIPAHRSS